MLKVDVEGVQETVYKLRNFEPELYKQMQKDIKSEPGLQSAMGGIKSRIPAVSPLRGMNHSGDSSYGGASVKVASRPSARLDRGSQRTIVRIDTVSPKSSYGFQLIDLVGSGARGNSPKAQGMKKKLQGSPSRFVWKGFETKQEGVTRAVMAIIERYANKVNVKLRSF